MAFNCLESEMARWKKKKGKKKRKIIKIYGREIFCFILDNYFQFLMETREIIYGF